MAGDGIPVTCCSHSKATQRHLSSLDPGHRVFSRDLSVSLNLCKRKKKRQGSQDFLLSRRRTVVVLPERLDSPLGPSTISLSPWSAGEASKVLKWTWVSEPEPFHLSVVDVVVS
jgi:hypothetical protein